MNIGIHILRLFNMSGVSVHHHYRHPSPLEGNIAETKFHVPHSQSLRSSIFDPIVLGLRQLRVTQVPAYALVVGILISFLAGSWIQTIEFLPTPVADGPQPTLGRRLSIATDSSRSISVTPTSLSRPSSTPLVAEEFEKFALDSSGFSKVRPPLSPVPESGEAIMHAIPFQTLSWYPRMTYYPGFVDKARCEHIIELTKKHLSPSGLAYKIGESIPETQDVRTSTGAFLISMMDPEGVLGWLEDRIAGVTHLPVEHGEAFNALRYMPTQHYDSHYDSFGEKEYGKQPSQRIATFLLFLNDVEEGGETVFKREGLHNGNRTITDWRTCDDGIGIKVKPKQGDAVLFWSATPDLTLDDHALHGACPVIKGEKWSIAKWIREKPIGMPRH